MRPAHNNSKSTVSLLTASLPALIEAGIIGYSRQTLPASADGITAFRHTLTPSEDDMPEQSPKENEASETINRIDGPGQPVETRAEKLARIKAEIEAGTYDTDEKLEASIDRMFGTLFEE